MAQNQRVYGFREDLIHSAINTSVNVRLLRVTCYGCDDWLIDVVVVIELSDHLSALVPVDERHVAVHQD